MIDEEELIHVANHTYGEKIGGTDRCPLCVGEHGGAGPCDHHRYSVARRRFLLAHLEELTAAHYNPDKRYSSALQTRLAREWVEAPSRHNHCWCRCPYENPARGYPACNDCQKLRYSQKAQEPIEFGRTAPVHAAMPNAEILDLLVGYL